MKSLSFSLTPEDHLGPPTLEDPTRSSISLLPTLSPTHLPLTMARPHATSRENGENEEKKRRSKKNHPATCLTESGRQPGAIWVVRFQ